MKLQLKDSVRNKGHPYTFETLENKGNDNIIVVLTDDNWQGKSVRLPYKEVETMIENGELCLSE